MNEPKNEAPQVTIQAVPGPAVKAQKVRSSRYEWESKTNTESEKAAGASGASRRSLVESAKTMLRKLFSGSRGFFDNDDDASPSAA